MPSLVTVSALLLSMVAVAGAWQIQPAPPMPTGGRVGRGPAPDAVNAPVVPLDQLNIKTVSLNIKDIPLRSALQQLREVSGMQFDIQQRSPAQGNLQDKRVTFESRDKPVWETFLGLLKQAEADDPIAMTFNFPQGGNYYVAGRTFAKGPFLLVARNISHDVPVQPGASDMQTGAIRLDIQILVDPSVQLTRISQQSTPTKATDDKGNSLIWNRTPVSSGMMSFGPSRMNVPNVAVLLQAPPAEVEAGRMISVLEGVFAATISSTETVETGPDKKLEKTTGPNGLIKVTAQWGTPEEVSLPATPAGRGRAGVNAPFVGYVRYEADPSLSTADWNSFMTLTSAAQLKLMDAEGHAFSLMGMTSGPGPGGARTRQTICGFSPDNVYDGRGGVFKAGDPVKAVLDLPVNPKSVEIPYHFEKIPLP